MDTIDKTAHASATRTLCEFLSAVRYEDIPRDVVLRTEDLFLDWMASALAGKDARPTRVMEQFGAEMGPADGAAEILVSRKRTSPVFAALINGAASHFVEQDDLHNSSVLHPGTVVFPAPLDELVKVSVSANFSVVRITGFFIPPARRANSPPPPASRISSGSMPKKCSIASVRQAPWQRGCGNSCVTQPIQNNCIPARRRPTV